MHHPKNIHLLPPITPVSLLSIDADSAAERLQIFNRKTGELLSHRKLSANNVNIFLPINYSSENNLMCVLLDDNAEFNAAIVDNVKPTPVDLISLDIDNPIPYEPTP